MAREGEGIRKHLSSASPLVRALPQTGSSKALELCAFALLVCGARFNCRKQRCSTVEIRRQSVPVSGVFSCGHQASSGGASNELLLPPPRVRSHLVQFRYHFAPAWPSQHRCSVRWRLTLVKQLLFGGGENNLSTFWKKCILPHRCYRSVTSLLFQSAPRSPFFDWVSLHRNLLNPSL